MKYSRSSPVLLALLMFTMAAPLRGAVPNVINYQGRVAVDGVNFSGIGEFKFAIIDGAGTLWRNDGTVAAGEPTTAVSLAIASGLYSLQLGDPALANMAALTLAPFQGPSADLRLRVWFRRNSVETFQQLAPDTRLSAAPFALVAQRAQTFDPGFLSGALNGYGLLGTTDSTPLTFQVYGQAVARFGLADGTAHALGSSANTINASAAGGTISGGGTAGSPNNVGAFGGTVGGGIGNNSSASYATIGGGTTNTAGGIASVVAGGLSNSASGTTSAVGGGSYNIASALEAVVAGGLSNRASGGTSSVGGGRDNTASGASAAIAGGMTNSASEAYSAVGGGLENFASGIAATVPGGRSNSSTGAYSFAAGLRAKATFPGSFVWADNTNADFTSSGANTFNIRASGGIALAPGTKFLNFVDFSGATIGSSTTAPLTFSVNGQIVGRLGLSGGYSHAFGYNNTASGPSTVIAGGSSNTASADFSAVSGGFGNVASGTAATVPGGWANSAAGAYSFAAGRRAKATFPGSFVWADSTDADFTSSGANTFNIRASGGIVLAPGTKFLDFLDFSECIIGSSTTAPLTFTVNGEVVGRLGLENGYSHTFGYNNTIAAGGYGSTISGGFSNEIEADNSTIGGGPGHRITGTVGTIAGGTANTVEGSGGSVGGGNSNRASSGSTVGGGTSNHATGLSSTIPGGTANLASGKRSFAAGISAKALHDGAWVWNSDDVIWDWPSTAPHQFLVNAAGGMGVNTNAPTATLHVHGTAKIQGGNNWDVTNSEGDFRVGNDVQRFKIGVAIGGGGAGDVLMRAQGGTARVFFKAPGGFNFHTNEAGTAGVAVAPGGGSWTTISDRNLKENFTPVDPLEVLAKVTALPVSTWNYKAQDRAIRHVGPMAQDFKAAFGVGESDTGITTVDADGVALAAIQGVNRKLEQEVATLRRELAELRAAVEKLAPTH